jgi:hypothetical protein
MDLPRETHKCSSWPGKSAKRVFAIVDPATRPLLCEVAAKKDVDARNKSGHDGLFALNE